MSAWRSSAPLELLGSPRANHGPPDEPDGPCQHHGCPRTGTATTSGLVACAFHRGADTVRARTRIIGQRAGDSE